ncbi:MAG: PEP-CTERM sorting domain-containing protein [Planctomycetes bacterium]|nr:PEP-CTERM sorting domain-containing protein [Planctomycetota bacterium]MCK5639733.1 PEP-CTERM sorting domain-containing protein [Gammaproteobacteria bacterium]
MKQMIIICVLAVAGLAGQSAAIITDVYVTPTDPMAWDDITIVTSGGEPDYPVEVLSSEFRINGNQLELDLDLSVGLSPAGTPWSYSEGIGTLAPGVYDLTVTSYYNKISYDPSSYSYSFEVVPEPVTAVLLGAGLLGVRLFRRKP